MMAEAGVVAVAEFVFNVSAIGCQPTCAPAALPSQRGAPPLSFIEITRSS